MTSVRLMAVEGGTTLLPDGSGDGGAGIESDIVTCIPLVAAVVIALGNANGSNTNTTDVSNDAREREPRGVEKSPLFANLHRSLWPDVSSVT